MAQSCSAVTATLGATGLAADDASASEGMLLEGRAHPSARPSVPSSSRTHCFRPAPCSAEPAGVPASDEAAAAAPSAAELDAFVQAQWEGLLLYLADSSGASAIIKHECTNSPEQMSSAPVMCHVRCCRP